MHNDAAYKNSTEGGNGAGVGGAGGSGVVIIRYIPYVRKKGQPHVNSGGMFIV